MAVAAWKAFERRVAKLFGGKRRGPDYGDVHGGKNDIICKVWSPECALLKEASYCHLLSKAKQSERNCVPGHIPIAVVKRKFQKDPDALVIMRLDTFAHWFLSPGSHGSTGRPAQEEKLTPSAPLHRL